MYDITQLAEANLRALQGPDNISQLVEKISSEAAARARYEILAEAQAEQAQQFRKVSHAQQVRNTITPLLEKISTAAAAQALHSVGQLHPQYVALLPLMLKQSAEAAEGIAEAVADGSEAEQELLENLVEAAASDPTVAAELISAETGTPVSPEEVEEAAALLAEAEIADAEGVSDADVAEKVSSIAYSLHNVQNTFPVAGTVLVKRSHAMIQALLMQAR